MTGTPFNSRCSVLHFIDTTGPGGAETVFLQVAQGLQRRGWAARLVLVGSGWVLDRARELDLHVDIAATRGRLDARFFSQLTRLVLRHDVRLIHAHLFSPAVYASMVGAVARVPVVATFHGTSDVESGGVVRSAKFCLINRHAQVTCVSRSLKEQTRRVSQLSTERVQVILNGIDTGAFRGVSGEAVRRELGVRQDTFLVGAIGNVRQAKDYPTFIRAAALLAHDDRVAFAIAGERTNPLFGELCEMRDQMGLRQRLAFLGFRDDVPALASAFDAMVISSSTEGFSLAAVQAMAAGTPVVATRSGGPEEIITDEHDGLLVPSGNECALAGAVRRLQSDAELLGRIARNARSTVEKRFSLHAMLDSYERLYASLSAAPVTGTGRPSRRPCNR